MHFDDAFQQAWPAFALVTGLLLVGLVAPQPALPVLGVGLLAAGLLATPS